MVFEHETIDGILRINVLNSIYGITIEDSPVVMGVVIDKILQVRKVERIILAETREYEYDFEQTAMLVELARVLDKLLNEYKILSISKVTAPGCEKLGPKWFANLQFIVLEMLKRDPIGAYVKVKREIRKIESKLKSSENLSARRCYAHYLKNALMPLKNSLEKTKIIQLVKDRLTGYRVGDRSLYREIFHPLIRPNFMLTRYMATPPKEGRLIERYTIGNNIRVEIFKIPGKVRPFYFIVPPEFRLPEEKYTLLDTARRYMAEHRPTRMELTEPERAREVFTNIGRDMIRELAASMRIRLTASEIEQLAAILCRYTAGFGILEILLADEKVQDVYINSPIGLTPVYIYHSDFEECETNLIPTREDAEAWATRFRMFSGRPLDEANPVLDTELLVPGGRARVCAITRTLSPEGLAYAFRRHREKPWTFPLFINAKMFDPLYAGLMSFIADGGRSCLVAGGRSAGKCVTGDTLIQLADGRIVPIKKIVNKIFRSQNSIKLGDDEIAIPQKLEVLTLDNDLKIRKARVAAVWKRKSPNKLIEVGTTNGRIVTTPEHPYITIHNGEIKSVEASDLKEGMIIAVPRRINIENTSMQNFSLFDLPDNLYAVGVHKQFLSEIKRTGLNLKEIAKELGISYNVLRYAKENRRYVKIEILKKFARRIGASKKIENSIKAIKGSTTSIPIKIPKIDEKFMSFLGYLFGDGSINKTKVEFHNSNEILRHEFMDICEKTFGIRGREEFPNKRTPKVTITSRALATFLHNIGIPYGRKSSKINLPDRFLKLGNNELKAFLRAYFSCDSYVAMNRREIETSTASKTMAKQLQLILLRFGIFSSISIKRVRGKKYYKILIEGENVNRFNQIGFSHPDKSRRLNYLVNKEWVHEEHCQLPGIEDLVLETFEELRVKLSRKERELLKIRPSVYQKRKWLLTEKKLRTFLNIFERRYKEILSLRDDIEKLRSYSLFLKLRKKLLIKLNRITEELKITYNEIGKTAKVSDKTVKRYLNGHITDLEKGNRILDATVALINSRFDGKSLNFLTTFKIAEEEFNPINVIKKIIKILNIEKKQLALLSGISITTLSSLGKRKLHPNNILKLIEGIEKIWEDINFGKIKNSLKKLKSFLDSDILWVKVKTIREIQPKEPYVYDLTVEPTHNFIANGMIVHNTSLLSALMLEIMKKFRICVVEDTLELPVVQLRNLGYNIERLKSRSVITRVEAELPADEALRVALRLGDSVLIVGEVRSKEAKALFEAMRIGAMANMVAGTIHGESPYGVFDRVVNDLGVPRTSFKAIDLITICSMLRSPDGIHRFRRVTELTEVRKHWREDPLDEGGFVALMEYDAKEDKLRPTDTLVNGESYVLNEIMKKVREWHDNWDAVWDNIELRAKIKQTMVDYARKLNRPDILEADWVVDSNEMFHIIGDKVRQEVGSLDSKIIYERWLEWFKNKLKEK
jgi:type IV secretory pathway ATPase VirB11/archaellum biosynthesis ATPase/transcriptional regulator with XRE-family HTH domain